MTQLKKNSAALAIVGAFVSLNSQADSGVMAPPPELNSEEFELVEKEGLQDVVYPTKKVGMIDRIVYGQLEGIAESATQVALQKVNDIFYLDPDLYGLNADGSKVLIYHKKSQLARSLIKAAMGVDLDNLGLPSIVTNTIQDAIIQQVIEPMSGAVVKEVIYQSLLFAYDAGKAHAKKSFLSTVGNILAKKESAPAIAPSVTPPPAVGLKYEEIGRLSPELQRRMDDPSVDIDLAAVVNYYSALVKSYVNSQFAAALEAGLAYSAQKVVEKSVLTAENYCSYLATGVVLLSPGPTSIAIWGAEKIAGKMIIQKANEGSAALGKEFAKLVSKNLYYQIWPLTAEEILQPAQKIEHNEIEFALDDPQPNAEGYYDFADPAKIDQVWTDLTPVNTPNITSYADQQKTKLTHAISETVSSVKTFVQEKTQGWVQSLSKWWSGK